MGRAISLLVVLLCAAAAFEIKSAGRLSSAVRDGKNVSPHVRALAGGTNFMFAVINSHIKDSDKSYSENILLTLTNYDSSNAATVVVSSPYPGVAGNFQIQPQQVYTFALPAAIQTNYRDLNVNQAVVENKSIAITSTTKISVVVSNAHDDGASEDTYVVFPKIKKQKKQTRFKVCNLGTDYRTANDESEQSTNMWTIVATADNTIVQVSPSLGVPPVNLKKGETLTFAASFATSNYHITATNPIAVISGTVCGFGYWNPVVCNFEAVMLQPLGAAGTNFPYSMFRHEVQGEMMLLGTQPSTNVFVDGKNVYTLNSQGYLIFSTVRDHFFSTDKPVHVYTVGSINYGGEGAPFLAHVPSVNRYTSDRQVIVTTQLINVPKSRHYVRIQTTLDSIDFFSIDGYKISGLFFTREGISNYYVADWPVPVGTHVISTSAVTSYAVTVYGYHTYVSYAYTPGIDLPATGQC